MPDRTYKIRPALAGQTLAAGLRRLLPEISWADAKRLVAGRFVHVNGNLCVDDARRLAGGDVVTIFAHARPAPPGADSIRVRHADADLIVIEKPAGVTTLRHADERGWDAKRKDRAPTLDELVQRLLPTVLKQIVPRDAPRAPTPPPRHPLGKYSSVPRHGRSSDHATRRGARRDTGRDPRRAAHQDARRATQPHAHAEIPRARPVHRLDRDTSGLMLFALSPRAEQALVAGFKSHAIRRAYKAVVIGQIDGEQTYQSHLVRDRGDGLRGSTPAGASDSDAQRAVTHVKPLEHVGDDYTLVECRLETGRTHQIRIHLSEAGHPLCGDRVYNRPAPHALPVPDRSGAPRQALHSAELAFTHPVTGKEMHFDSPLPSDLAVWLRTLRVGEK